MLLIALLDGSIVGRFCASMNLVFIIIGSICASQAIWSIESLGQSCFAVGSDDGQLIVWKIEQPLIEQPT